MSSTLVLKAYTQSEANLIATLVKKIGIEAFFVDDKLAKEVAFAEYITTSKTGKKVSHEVIMDEPDK